jgi:hypothetical protein
MNTRRKTMNKAEQKASWSLFCRKYDYSYETSKQTIRHYRAFRRNVIYSHMGCWLVCNWHGMTVGIESDGYTHS